jgi:hypothetical protein
MQAVNLGLKRLRAMASEDKQPTGELLDRLIDDVGDVIAELRTVSVITIIDVVMFKLFDGYGCK